MIDEAKAARLGEIDVLRAKGKKDDDALLAERRILEAELLTQFEGGEIQRIRVAGRTVYMQRQIWANAKRGEDGERDYAAANAGLRAAGLEVFIAERFNVQTLSGYVRNDLPRTADEMPILPPELADVLDVAEVFTIKSQA